MCKLPGLNEWCRRRRKVVNTLADLALAKYSWLAKELSNNKSSFQQNPICPNPLATTRNLYKSSWSIVIKPKMPVKPITGVSPDNHALPNSLPFFWQEIFRCFGGAWFLTLVSLSVGISLLKSLSVKSGIRKLHSKLFRYEKRGAEISLQQALERVPGISGGTVR